MTVFERKPFEGRQAAGLQVQMAKVEAPTVALFAAVLADQAIEPAIKSAGEIEIGPVDGQHERVVEDGLIEPVRHDHLDTIGAAVAVGALLPFVDPGEAMPAAFSWLPDRGGNGGRPRSRCSQSPPSAVKQNVPLPLQCVFGIKQNGICFQNLNGASGWRAPR